MYNVAPIHTLSSSSITAALLGNSRILFVVSTVFIAKVVVLVHNTASPSGCPLNDALLLRKKWPISFAQHILYYVCTTGAPTPSSQDVLQCFFINLQQSEILFKWLLILEGVWSADMHDGWLWEIYVHVQSSRVHINFIGIAQPLKTPNAHSFAHFTGTPY